MAAAGAVALALAVSGRSCRSADDLPAAAARAFVEAARMGDKRAAWALLGPETRRRFEQAAQDATERVGGARRFEPLDVLELGAPATSYAPTEVVSREVRGDRAVVDVLGPAGRRDALQLVRVEGRWRVELEF